MPTVSKCNRSCNRDFAHKVYLDKTLRIALKKFLENRIGGKREISVNMGCDFASSHNVYNSTFSIPISVGLLKRRKLFCDIACES